MLGTVQLHIEPDDRFDPHLSTHGGMPIIGVDDGDQHLALFFRDEATYRRFAKAVVDGLALLRDGEIVQVPA